MSRAPKTHSKGIVRKKQKWYGRLCFKRPDGRWAERVRRAANKTNAKSVADDLLREYLEEQKPVLAPPKNPTFAEVCADFRQSKMIDAVYLGERKVAGYKHPKKLNNQILRLERRFGEMRASEITVSAIEAYKLHLIQTPTQHGRPRSPHDVNQQLRTLRLLLNHARRQGWILQNPFEQARLINSADEQPRFRPEGEGELERLLAEAKGRRAHIRPWIVLAVETAMRAGEINGIRRADVLFDEGVIVARQFTTKTNRRREVPLTPLLAEELRAWLAFVAEDEEWSKLVPDKPDAPIFGAAKSNKTAFNTACRRAGIQNLQRKDFRKWGTTRLVQALRQAGIAEIHAMKVTGHTQFKTFESYVITDREIVRDAGRALEVLRERKASASNAPQHRPAPAAG